ncbi:MAG TPA: serine protease [Gammaproteobacteria bacterium]
MFRTALAGLFLLAAGCASHIDSYHENGLYVVAPYVNPPTAVPAELNDYVPRFEQLLEFRGLHMGKSDSPRALSLQLAYSDTPDRITVSAFLLQNNTIILRAVSSNSRPDSTADKHELVAELVDTAVKAFEKQLDEFQSQVRVDTSQGRADTVGGNGDGQTHIVGFGTAFATNSPTTYVTARHVVDGAVRLHLYCGPDKVADAEVLAVDTSNDLAVLKSKMAAPAFLELAPADSAGPGDHVFTIGFPTPDLLGVAPKYSDGAISALSGFGDTRSLMQITVPIQPGNSGGPLVDAQGRVVGVIDSTAAVANFYKLSGGALPQNINFAVSSYYLYPLVKDIPRGSTARFAKLTAVKKVTASLCLVVNEKD